MPLLIIPTFERKKPTKTTSLSQRQSSPFNIPEVLENIFSFLTPYALRKTISLVCQQWHAVAQPFIPQEPITWNLDHRRAEEELKKMVEDSDKMRTLIINVSRYNYNRAMDDVFSKMITLTGGHHLDIKHLTIKQSKFATQYETEIAVFLNYTGMTLRTLHLQHIAHQCVPLNQILHSCPQLHTLIIDNINTSQVQSFRSDINTSWINPSSPFSLQSLTLKNVNIDANALIQNLRLCPNLDELSLVQILGFHEPSTDGTRFIYSTAIMSVFQRSFYTQIALSCPMLKKIHLSDIWTTTEFPQLEKVEELLDTFPLISDWGFRALMVKRFPYDCFKLFTRDVITTLEITEEWTYWNDAHDILHKYLCESPQLLHLIAPKYPMRICMFDLEGILSGGSYIHNYGYLQYQRYDVLLGAPYNRKIWACRKLKTLHLKFLYNGSVDSVNGELSRFMFGYISKVCPHLQDLAINRQCLVVNHFGGMCLLGRLRDLRKLKITTDTLFKPGTSDFHWITKSSSYNLRVRMAAWIAKFWCQEPKKLYARTPFHSNTRARAYPGDDFFTPGHQEDHIIDGVDMTNLGREMDIVSYYQDRLSNDFPCLPNLEHVSVGSREMLAELKKIRPELRLTLE